MINMFNILVESLESYYFLRIRCYVLCDGFGGVGCYVGGVGLICEFEFFDIVEVIFLIEC